MPFPLIALAPAIAAGAARAAAPAVGKAVAQGAAKNAGKAAAKPPAPKPQPPKQNNTPKPKDDKKPEPKKEDKKPEPKKEDKKAEPKKEDKKTEPKEDKKPEPNKQEKKPEEKKPEANKQEKKHEEKKQDMKQEPNKQKKKPEPNKEKKPVRDREDREELTEQVLDTTSQVIDRITNRPGRDDDSTSDSVKPAGPKPKNPVVAPKAPKAGDMLVSLAVKNNGQDWFWFVHHPTEANTGMTMHAEGTITKGFTIKLTRKTTVEKLKSAAGTKSLDLIKLQWVEKRWWDEDMFGANKAAKAEAPFETTAFGVKPPTVTECAPVKESATEMAKDRVAARIKRKDDKTWILESCEALVRAGALKQNVLTFLEKLKDSYGTLGGKKPTTPDVSPANPGKQSRSDTPTKGRDCFPTKTNKPGTASKPVDATPKKTVPGKGSVLVPGLAGALMGAQVQVAGKVATNTAAVDK
ncbi:hypothetical protein QBC41DRAFT_313672 [Cercophora samala]|uniref:Uncharacterized protein n=1 Tax=Cercophora samala TaxID=330535 RepID=A0AA39ZJU3_9PEZI|nr:hypothetical protein QBC41DRAFT_313672 [Cercophora samala]